MFLDFEVRIEHKQKHHKGYVVKPRGARLKDIARILREIATQLECHKSGPVAPIVVDGTHNTGFAGYRTF
jgi:hypothetical protein